MASVTSVHRDDASRETVRHRCGRNSSVGGSQERDGLSQLLVRRNQHQGLLVASPAFAQTNLTGDWDVTVTSPQGTNTTPVTFKQDGAKVSGVFKSPITRGEAYDQVVEEMELAGYGAPILGGDFTLADLSELRRRTAH